ncbi:NAD-dependent epimerase/dehydratase family protein [Rhodosalinus sp.]|uniref:NAD-dependent epimerase/dehydratase family protein n=1 Tax=Rhodosalinus sp. TaxID=2047741 RepID=UPI003979A524
MKLAVTGGTGLVGRFLVEEALAAGDTVTVLTRRPPAPGFFSAPVAHLPYDLSGATPPLAGIDALIHAGFSHVPGRYRGGEGDDPEGFLRSNGDGTLRLFEAAARSGVGRVVCLSSRAVYGDYPPGTELTEAMPPRPDTLYGEAKAEAEVALADLPAGVALRATGVYGPAGPGQRHKWADLFGAFLRGEPIEPRRGTEVHGDDLAAAVRLVLDAPQDLLGDGIFNVSDILLDRHDLLAEVARLTGAPHPLPAQSDAPVSAMRCDRLRALGWRPGGMARLRASLPAMLQGVV